MIRTNIKLTPANAAEFLQRFPRRALGAVAKRLDLENELTIGHAQTHYLSGPRPKRLGVVTNRLRSSLSRSDAVVVDDRRVVSSIGSNVAYAGVHEHGFNGIVDVRQHTRHQVSNDILKGSGRRGFVRRSRREVVLASGIAVVSSHQREMNVPARPFVGPSLDDRQEDYERGIAEAIEQAWQDNWQGGSPS